MQPTTLPRAPAVFPHWCQEAPRCGEEEPTGSDDELQLPSVFRAFSRTYPLEARALDLLLYELDGLPDRPLALDVRSALLCLPRFANGNDMRLVAHSARTERELVCQIRDAYDTARTAGLCLAEPAKDLYLRGVTVVLDSTLVVAFVDLVFLPVFAVPASAAKAKMPQTAAAKAFAAWADAVGEERNAPATKQPAAFCQPADDSTVAEQEQRAFNRDARFYA